MAVRKTKKGASLKRWFKEKWVDVRTGKALRSYRKATAGAYHIVDQAKEYQAKHQKHPAKCLHLKRLKKFVRRKV